MKSRAQEDADVFFFNDTATTEIYTLSLHDALPILVILRIVLEIGILDDHDLTLRFAQRRADGGAFAKVARMANHAQDRKSTRLNSSHANISYAVFCLKKKKNKLHKTPLNPTHLDHH